MTTPTFTFGGLSSGLDTNKIIDTLVSIERRTVDMAKKQQAAYDTQISLVGELTSKLAALSTATEALTSDGVLGYRQVGTTSGFTTTLTSTATAATYDVTVNELATAAKARSAGFASGTTVTGTTLSLSIDGTSQDIVIDDGATLESVAQAINDSGLAVSAAVLDTGGTRYLSLTAANTGFTVGQPASSALSITETVTGTQGQALGLVVTDAKNASLSIDGLPFERRSNTITDVLEGVTFSLTTKTTTAETFKVETDAAATKDNLTTFVTAYNELMTLVRKQLNVDPEANRAPTLAGDSTVRALQASMQRMVSGELVGTGSVRSLADLGIKTGIDGSLSLDETKLGKVLSADPAAVNSLFQTATTGLGDVAEALKTTFTDSVDGLFTSKKQMLDRSVRRMDDTIASLELRLASYRERLILQFTAMEKIVSGFKSIGQYLEQQSALNTKSES